MQTPYLVVRKCTKDSRGGTWLAEPGEFSAARWTTQLELAHRYELSELPVLLERWSHRKGYAVKLFARDYGYICTLSAREVERGPFRGD